MKFVLWISFILAVYMLYRAIKKHDTEQKQHAVLRTHPILGRLRYLFEAIGPEFRQYWFLGDKEARPIDRMTNETIAKASKYGSTTTSFGSRRDFSLGGYFLVNATHPKNKDEMEVDNSEKRFTFQYKIEKETMFGRKEERYATEVNPYHLPKEKAIVIGKDCEKPFIVNGFIGISAMSFGALSASAVKALSQGTSLSGAAFMNSGEGGVSNYHLSKIYRLKKEHGLKVDSMTELEKKVHKALTEEHDKSNFGIQDDFGDEGTEIVQKWIENGEIEVLSTPIIFQVGSGLFGARKDGKYSEEVFLENANKEEVKAIEIKLAQGAKVRGGKLPKEKITEEIAAIRGVPMGQDVESPNRNPLFSTNDELIDLIARWKEITGKPVGIKVVCGNENSFEEMAQDFIRRNIFPDFITIDGGEGGTGATYQEMADTLGLPLYQGLPILHKTLIKYNIRDRIKIIASGSLITADKIAIAMSLGANLVATARGAMISSGCISSFLCHSNRCPVGITTHNPELEKGLVVEEKRYRVMNYLCTMREGVYALAASCGVSNPTELNEKHVVYVTRDAKVENF